MRCSNEVTPLKAAERERIKKWHLYVWKFFSDRYFKAVLVGRLKQMSQDKLDVVIIENSSVELLPKELWSHESAKRVQDSFGVAPRMQILDWNYHRAGMSKLRNIEKRGRPDVVHFALLDATSTPIFASGKLKVVIHALNGDVISPKNSTHPPRTLNRFCGVMAKILAGEEGPDERNLFQIERKKSFKDLLSMYEIDEAVSLTRLGTGIDLRDLVKSESSRRAYAIGGFAHGHFDEEVILNSKPMSISKEPLAAHVVSARLSYELERSKLM